MNYKIYCDGAASNNGYENAIGGWAFVALDENENVICEAAEMVKGATNNRMELLAAIVGLEALRRPCDVELTSDSKYLVDAFNQKWVDGWVKKGWKGANKQPVKNQDLWKRLLEAKKNHNVKFIWVKGHNGHEFNERCDEMAVASANGENLLTDTGFTGA